MDLITCHISADFDCLAAIAAAEKLYPGATAAFSGSQEPSVREFLRSGRCALQVLKPRQVEPDAVGRLIVVDTQSRARIGEFQPLLDRADVPVHVYDHHAEAVRDFRADVEDIRPVGATTTILVDILRTRDIPITPEEATLFNLGIHADTRSFSSVNTTPRDLEAAAFLASRGADPAAVADWVHRELNAVQVALLHELMESAESVRVLGVPVAVATASREEYVDDVALVAQKFQAAHDAPAFFFLVRLEGKVQLIARSRVPEIDVGAVAASFGGGGHPSAASSSIKDLTLFQARDRLIERLHRETRGRRKAGEIMASPVRTVRAEDPIRDAGDLMTRYNLNTLPVMEGRRVAGLITRPAVEQAIVDGVGADRVADSMNRNFETLTPDAPADRALELILGRRQKAIPVLGRTDPDVKHAPLKGIITRGDAVRLLQQERNPEGLRAEPYTRSVRTLARARLSEPVREVLEEAAHTAEAQGCRVYLVGGIIRDLMLGIDNPDVDLVVEGDGIALARALAARMGGRSKAHPRFGVAVVTLPDGRKVDVATARVEYYEQPAALPVVEMSDIRTDLSRRDFSINAMAVQLNGEGAWRLLDFFGARRDLKDKVLRVLHNLSFVEDPTRAFRAVRFSERYGFVIGAQTRTLLDHAVRDNLIDRLSGSRLFTELRLILDGPGPWRCVARLGELKLLRFIHPRLRETPALGCRFEDIDRALAWFKLLFPEEPVEAWRIYLMGLLGDLTDEEAEAAYARLALPGRRRDPTLQARREVVNILAGLSGEEVPPSAVYRLLHPLKIETLLYCLAVAPSQRAKKRVSLHLTHLRDVNPAIGGKDLLAMGVEPGPLYGELLGAARDALLDGDIEAGEIHERAYVRRLLTLHGVK